MVVEMEWIRVVTELGSFGLFVWLVRHTFGHSLPTMIAQFRDDLRLEREATERSHRELARAIEQLSLILLYHDATVRGVDPAALGSTEELLRLLRSGAVGESHHHA